MTIYLDSLFLLNFLLDYLLLLLTGRLIGAVLPRRRILLASLLGAADAAVVFYPGLSVFSHPVLRVSVGVIMVLIAYGNQRHFFKTVLIFFALSAALGGALYAISLLNIGVTSVHGLPVPLLDLKLILLFAVLAYILLSLIFRKFARHSPFELRDVILHSGGDSIHLKALLDSGNTLSDPMTGKPVLVAEAAALKAFLPPELDCQNPALCFPRLSPPGRFRLLPYRSVGIDRGLLLAWKVDSIEINGKTISSDLVALSPTPVSENGNFQALVNPES